MPALKARRQSAQSAGAFRGNLQLLQQLTQADAAVPSKLRQQLNASGIEAFDLIAEPQQSLILLCGERFLVAPLNQVVEA